jgi:DNA-binding GntR family transcriptional regulator
VSDEETSGTGLLAVGRQLQLKDLAYERLRDGIVTLVLPPGAQLREAAIAEQLGISKTPIREAFVRLEREGLVDIEPYRGVTVRGYTAEDLEQIFELRALLEGHCAAQAADLCHEAWRAELQANVARSRQALATGRTAEVVASLEDFDRIIQSRTTNGRIADLLEQLRCHVERIGRLTVAIPGRLDTSVDQHEKIAEAVLAGRGRTAETLMRSHIRSVLGDQLAAIEVVGEARADGVAVIDVAGAG